MHPNEPIFYHFDLGSMRLINHVEYSGIGKLPIKRAFLCVINPVQRIFLYIFYILQFFIIF